MTIEDLYEKFNEQFNKIDERFDKIEERLDKMEERLDKMEERLDKIEERLDSLEEQVRHTNFRIDNEIWPAIKIIAEGHDYTNSHVKAVEAQNEELTLIKLRLTRLEDKVYGSI